MSAKGSTNSKTTQVDLTIGGPAIKSTYRHRFDSEGSSPWLDNNEHLQECLSQNQWKRWDGTVGTAREHMEWTKRQVQSFFSKERQCEFREWGKYDGCQFYIHDKLTNEGDGFGLFKIEGRTYDVEPKDVLRKVFDVHNIVEHGSTCVYYKMLKTFAGTNRGDPYCSAVYWSEAPGFPFYYRDGIDLTGYLKDDNDDDDGTIWQLGVGVDIDNFESQPGSIQAVDRYWAYRLQPIEGGKKTKVSIICQSCLNGWIPKFLSNKYVCQVLVEYLPKMEADIQKLKKEDPEGYQTKLKELELDQL